MPPRLPGPEEKVNPTHVICALKERLAIKQVHYACQAGRETLQVTDRLVYCSSPR